MQHAQILQRALILLVFAAGARIASDAAGAAPDTGWPAFPDRCHAELKPDWAIAAEKGKKWDAESAENLAKLTELADRICPDYLKRPNDSDAIRAFAAAKGAILDQSPVVEKKGDELFLFLKLGLLDYTATFAPAEIDFPASTCGQHMLETQKRTAARLSEIRGRINKLAKTCFGVTDQQNAEALKNHVNVSHGQGAPAGGTARGVPAGASHGGGSDITGIPEDKAKAPQQ